MAPVHKRVPQVIPAEKPSSKSRERVSWHTDYNDQHKSSTDIIAEWLQEDDNYWKFEYGSVINFEGKNKTDYCKIILKRIEETGHIRRSLGSMKLQMYAIRAKFENAIEMLKCRYSLSDEEIKSGNHDENMKSDVLVECEQFYMLRKVMLDPKPSPASAQKMENEHNTETSSYGTIQLLPQNSVRKDERHYTLTIVPEVDLQCKEDEDDDRECVLEKENKVDEGNDENWDIATHDDKENELYDAGTLQLVSQQISSQMNLIASYTSAGIRKIEQEERKIAEEEERFAQEVQRHQMTMDALRMNLLKVESENLESERKLRMKLQLVEVDKKNMTRTMKKRKIDNTEKPSTEMEKKIIETLSEKFRTNSLRNVRHLLDMLPIDHPKRLEYSEKFIQDFIFNKKDQ